MEIKIKVIPVALIGAAAAFLWWTRPAKTSFGIFFTVRVFFFSAGPSTSFPFRLFAINH